MTNDSRNSSPGLMKLLLWYNSNICFALEAEVEMNRTQDLGKLNKLTGDRAKLDAKANGTYILFE